jgi:hypothetical protein
MAEGEKHCINSNHIFTETEAKESMKEAGSKIAEKGRGKDFILHGPIYLLCFSKLIRFFFFNLFRIQF